MGDPGQDRRVLWASCLAFRSDCISAELQSMQVALTVMCL